MVLQFFQGFFTVSGFQYVEQCSQTAAEIMANLLIVFHNKDGSAFLVARLYGFILHFLRIDEIHFFGVGGVHLLFFLGSVGACQLGGLINGQVLRQIDGECTSLALFALQFDASVVQIDQTLYQRQSDAASYMLAFYLIEAFEHFTLLIDRNAGTGVAHLQYQPVVFLFQGNGDTLSVVRIFESIGQKIVDNQFQIVRVEKFLFFFQIGVESVVYLFVACQLVIIQEVLAYQAIGITFLYFQLENSEFRPAVVHKLVDKMQQAVGIPLDVFQLVAGPAVVDFTDDLLKRCQD